MQKVLAWYIISKSIANDTDTKEKTKKVIAIELDGRMIDILQDRFSLYNNLCLFHSFQTASGSGDVAGSRYDFVNQILE